MTSFEFTILWAGWVVAFFVIEGIAIKRKAPGDTLSEKLRSLFHAKTKTGITIFAVAVAGFAGLLILHIANVGWW